MEIAMQIVALLSSILVTLVAVLASLTFWRIAFRHQDFSLFILGSGFWLVAFLCTIQAISIVSNHFDLMQSSAFDAATHSISCVCGVLVVVLFWVWLLTSAFQLLRAKPPR